nr:unnamed protein product [Spirometra erinaceieuropaei]
MLRQMQLRWSGHLVRMHDGRLPKRIFYGDFATGSRRQGGQIRRYKDTLKSSLKHLQINPTNWEELALDRPTWRRKVKTGVAIYEANRIAAAKVKRDARKSQPRPARNADAQPLPTCSRCQRTFQARIGLIGHLRTNRTSHTAPTAVPPPASSSSSPPPTNSDNSSEPPLPSFPSSSSSPLLLLPFLLLLLLFPILLSLLLLLLFFFFLPSFLPPPLSLPPPAPLHQPRPLWWPSLTAASHTSMTQQQTPSLQPPTAGMRTRTTPALTATAPSPHISAWSVTCKSIAQRLANQCQEHQPTPTALAFTAHTALAPSRIAWAYSATCASTTTCGRQPPATPHHNTLPPCLHHHHHTSALTHRKHPTATSHASGKCASRLGPHAASAARNLEKGLSNMQSEMHRATAKATRTAEASAAERIEKSEARVKQLQVELNEKNQLLASQRSQLEVRGFVPGGVTNGIFNFPPWGLQTTP